MFVLVILVLIPPQPWNNKSILENNTPFLAFRWGQSFVFLIFCPSNFSLRSQRKKRISSPGWLQPKHLLRQAFFLSCHTLSQSMQLFTCGGLWFCPCRGISSRPGSIFLLLHRTLGVGKLGFLRCAVAFLQELTVIISLRFGSATFVSSMMWSIGWAMPQPRGSARLSRPSSLCSYSQMENKLAHTAREILLC